VAYALDIHVIQTIDIMAIVQMRILANPFKSLIVVSMSSHHISRLFFVFLFLISLSLSACGIKPKKLVPPSQANEKKPQTQTEQFKRTYPDPELY